MSGSLTITGEGPAGLTADYIAERWPRLFHMAEAGSWPSISLNGLLSTTALLDRFEISGLERAALESQRRPNAVELHHPSLGSAWIRDNKPINETALQRTLVGMTVPQWYETLNGRVFFWLSRERLDRLRDARPYRGRPHDVLALDTAPCCTHTPTRSNLRISTPAPSTAAPPTPGAPAPSVA